MLSYRQILWVKGLSLIKPELVALRPVHPNKTYLIKQSQTQKTEWLEDSGDLLTLSLPEML